MAAPTLNDTSLGNVLTNAERAEAVMQANVSKPHQSPNGTERGMRLDMNEVLGLKRS